MDEGIVRSARRPPGWHAPGPPPAAPSRRPDLWPRAGEDLCHLSGDWRILQRLRGHRWSLDDLVTAWVAASSAAPGAEVPPARCAATAATMMAASSVAAGAGEGALPRAGLRIADLGCGIGAVLLLLAWRFPAARLFGVEAQAESAALARRSVAWNGAEDRCEVRDGDLRDAGVLAGAARFDLVTGTPPYLPRGTGREPTRSLQAACHLEHRGGIEDYCAAAARLLRPGGLFVVCHSSEQRSARAAAAAGLALRACLRVVPRAGKAPLFSVLTLAAEDEGELAVSELVVRTADGQWSEAFRGVRRAMGMPDRVVAGGGPAPHPGRV